MQNQDKFLIVVGGPTASGKTALAIKLALHFDTEIISSDSRQFYRELEIGTAKPNSVELKQAIHHFVNQLSIDDDYSIGAFERDALKLLDKLFKERQMVILVGGSGMYIKALCEGLDEFPKVSQQTKNDLQKWFEHNGLEALQAEVARLDPEYYQQVDRHNPQRLLRALSVMKTSGLPFSGFRKAKQKTRRFFPIYLWMDWPRDLLYQRINLRVDQMVSSGLVDEARSFIPQRDLNALQTVGYQELFPAFDGQYTVDEGIELIKRNSRRYAKRQLTWSRRDGFWKHVQPNEWSLILDYIHSCLEYQWKFSEESLEHDNIRLNMNSKSEYIQIEVESHKNGKALQHFQTNVEDQETLRFFEHEVTARYKLPVEIKKK